MLLTGRWFLTSIILLCLMSCTTGGTPSFVPGEDAPDFSLRDTDGNTVRLSDLKGKVVLLNFWATWCGPCVAELPSLQHLHATLKDKGLVILGVGVDDDRDNFEQFKKVHGLGYSTVVDVTGSVKRTYKLTGVPESFFIDREGKFILLPDPQTNEPVVRIVGPREWDTPNGRSRIQALLAQ